MPANESDLLLVRMKEHGDNEETYLEGVYKTGDVEELNTVSFWRNCLASETKRLTKARLASRLARSMRAKDSVFATKTQKAKTEEKQIGLLKKLGNKYMVFFFFPKVLAFFILVIPLE